MPKQALPVKKQRVNRIYKMMTYETDNLEDQIHYVLEESTKFLDADLGIISRIEEDTYTILDFYSVSPTELTVGQIFELGNTYCSITYGEDSIVDIHNMGESPYNGHPCYELFGLETYIGVPIWIEGKRYGTLNFSSTTPRTEPFSVEDYDFVFIMGQLISTALTRSGFEQQLKSKNAVLEKKNIQLEELINENRGMMHMMVHDLKSPVNNIRILSQMIAESCSQQINEPHFRHLNREVSKADQIIVELSYYHRLEHGEIQMGREQVDLTGLLKEVVAGFKPYADEKSIKLELDAVPGSLQIETDKLALNRILDNLISNAIKFSPFERKVGVRLDCDQEGVAVSVTDQGPGLTDLDKQKLFARFQSLSARPTNKEVSTGLGLATVKLLSDNLGYKIVVESAPGEGSTFSVAIPLKDPSPKAVST